MNTQDNPHQWGLKQWVAHLTTMAIPILARTQRFVSAMVATGQDIAPRDMVEIVYNDPFLCLRLLLSASAARANRLGSEITTPLGALLYTGYDPLVRAVQTSKTCPEGIAGLDSCEARAFLSAHISRQWSILRVDISADEIAVAAVLSEIGELMLWAFAPRLPDAVLRDVQTGRAADPVEAQVRRAGFTFRQLSLQLAKTWGLPELLVMLIEGSDNVRANIARLAVETARHIQSDPRNPALVDDLLTVSKYLPNIPPQKLISPLPIAEDFKSALLGKLDARPRADSACRQMAI